MSRDTLEIGPAPRYELEDVLGEGGMGRVYRAVHRPSSLPVAIKTLRSELASPTARRLLLREAAAAARLDHPRIVKLLDLTRDEDGRPALVMELVEGHDMSLWVDFWPGFSKIARALRDTLTGLAVAHGAGIVHRDLKPENLLVTDGRVKITDFGVAEVLDPLRRDGLDMRAVGTPIYMAPEQLDPRLDIGPWTDLYAFGVILYELLYGEPPHVAQTVGELLAQKRSTAFPARPLRRGLSVPRGMIALLETLLDPEPRRRVRFAAEVEESLALLNEAVEEDLEQTTGRRAKSPHRADATSDAAATVDTSMLSSKEERADTISNLGETVDLVGVDELYASSESHAAPSPPRTRTRSTLPAPPSPGTGTRVVRLRRPGLVGRLDERNTIDGMLGAVAGGGGVRLVGLVGAAGAGKSALARWGLDRVERCGLMEGVAAGYDLTGTVGASGLRHAVRRLLGSPIPIAEEKPWAWLRGPEGELPFDEAEMAAFVSGSMEEALGADHIATLAEVAIAAASRVRPVYLWLDDVGWSRDGALTLVERLLARADELDVAIALTVRSGTADHGGIRARLDAVFAHEAASLLELGALEEADRRALLDATVELAPGLAPRFAARLDDLPLMLLTRVHAWIDGGTLVSASDGYRPAEGVTLDDLFTERAVEEALAERLDSLTSSFGGDGELAATVLITSALLGRSFEENVLVEACADSLDTDRVHMVMDRAVLTGLLRGGARGEELRFDHGLLQELLEARAATHPDRRTLLRNAAEALLAAYEMTRPGVGDRVAELLHQSGDVRRAVEALVLLAEAHNRAGVLDESKRVLTNAERWLDVAGISDSDVIRGRVLLADAERAYFAVDYPTAESVLRGARSIFEAKGQSELLVAAMNLESGLLFYQNKFREAQRVAREMEAVTTPGSGLRYRALHRQIQIATLVGDTVTAMQIVGESMRHARLSKERWRYRASHIMAAECELTLGRIARARLRLTALIDEARAIGDAFAIAEVGDLWLWILVADGAWDEVANRVEQRIKILAHNEDAWRLTMAKTYRALASAGRRDDVARLTDHVEGHLEAVRMMPNDEPTTRFATRRLAIELRAAGHPALAARVDQAFMERHLLLQSCFSDGSRVIDPADTIL